MPGEKALWSGLKSKGFDSKADGLFLQPFMCLDLQPAMFFLIVK